MKKIFSLILISAVSFLPFTELKAQSSPYAQDALLFSRHTLTGSARIRGMGGVQTSLGGDISAAFSNPAGLGFYNRSEIAFTPSFLNNSTNATYRGNTVPDYTTNLHVSNLGMVIANPKQAGEGWLGGNFAISYQRINNFNQRFNYQALNPSHGLIDVISNNFAEFGQDDPLAEMAVKTYLVGDYDVEDRIPNTLVYPPSEEDAYDQSESVNSRGSQNQLSIAYGGNFSDKFYVGANVGLVNLDYRRERDFVEYYFPEDDVNAIALNEIQTVQGSGVNATLGLIFRPIEAITLGISYQTPTMYSLEENHDMQLEVLYNNLTVIDENESVYLDGWEPNRIVSAFNYRLRTPGRLNLGGTFFIEKQGFISADVEVIDYRNNRLSDRGNYLNTDNQEIQSSFASAVNLRVGGEYRLNLFRFRAGYALNGDPYYNNGNRSRARNIISAGAGIRLPKYYIDFAVNRESGSNTYNPYYLGDLTPVVSNELVRTTALLSVGLNF